MIGCFVNEDILNDIDVWVLENGYILVVLLMYDLINYDVIKSLVVIEVLE